MIHTTNTLFDEITNIFNDAFAQFSPPETTKKHQLFSTPEGWTTRVDLPGYEKSDLSLDFKEDALTLTAENEARGPKNLRFALGDEVEIKKITAKLENGVLEITLPKKEDILPETLEIEID